MARSLAENGPYTATCDKPVLNLPDQAHGYSRCFQPQASRMSRGMPARLEAGIRMSQV